MTDDTIWPAVAVAAWAPTKKSFHLYAQMLGKLRLALSPAQPNWMFTALLLSARGVTTGPMPWRGTAVEASLDVFSSELIVERSNGEAGGSRSCRYGRSPRSTPSCRRRSRRSGSSARSDRSPRKSRTSRRWPRTAAPRSTSLRRCGAGLRPRWRRRASSMLARPLLRPHRHPGLVGRARRFVVAVQRQTRAAADRPRLLMRYDLDAEMMAAGLFYGDEKTAPSSTGTSSRSRPAGDVPIAPAAATWSEAIKEWVLRVQLFGRPRLSLGETAFPVGGRPKVVPLLAYLLLHRGAPRSRGRRSPTRCGPTSRKKKRARTCAAI